eukprot:4350814-Pyramimonas_sp.AAC.1
MGCSTERPSGRVRMAGPPDSGAHLTRFAAPWGPPPNAPVAGFAWRARPISAHLTRFAAPW